LGKVRTGKVKGVALELFKKYPNVFSTDFDTNKKLVSQYSDISSKHLNNRVAGYLTRLLIAQKKRDEALKAEEAEMAKAEAEAASAPSEAVIPAEAEEAGTDEAAEGEGVGEGAETETKAETESEAEAEAEVETEAETEPDTGAAPEDSDKGPEPPESGKMSAPGNP